MRPVKVGLLGFGTVGTGVVRIVEGHQEDLRSQVGSPIVIEKVLVQNPDKLRSIDIDRSKLTTDPWEIIHNPEIDIVVEVMGGIENTKAILLEALSQGKHIVTANKDLMALHGREILAKASQQRCHVLYEASVAGGIPIIRTLIEGFSSDRIIKIMGIVNGTTNYILTKMSSQEGASYGDVLKEAQDLGYAEADPTSDVEGLDAARKMTILSRLGFRSDVDLEDVSVQGISAVGKEDIAYATSCWAMRSSCWASPSARMESDQRQRAADDGQALASNCQRERRVQCGVRAWRSGRRNDVLRSRSRRASDGYVCRRGSGRCREEFEDRRQRTAGSPLLQREAVPQR